MAHVPTPPDGLMPSYNERADQLEAALTQLIEARTPPEIAAAIESERVADSAWTADESAWQASQNDLGRAR